MWEIWPDEKSGIKSAESDCPRAEAEETNVAVAGTYVFDPMIQEDLSEPPVVGMSRRLMSYVSEY